MTVTNRGMKLLYVHDNAKGEDSLQKKLIRNGACVAQTRQLDEYMDRVKREEFDAVLLDLTQLENNGVDACQRLSREAPDVPVVALTEHHDEAKAVNAIAAGAQDYLVKSRVSTTDLALRIRAALARRVREAAALTGKMRANAESLDESGYMLTVPAWGVAVLPNGAPDRERMCSGYSVSIGSTGITLELDGVADDSIRDWVIGVEHEDGEMRFASIQATRITESSIGMTLSGKYLTDDQDLFGEANCTPDFDASTRSYKTGWSAEVLEQWEELGVLRAELVDNVLTCPKCDSALTVRNACRVCGSTRINTSRLIHHLACGHIAPDSTFESDGLIVCSKCRLRDLVAGTDFEYLPGPYDCEDCSWSDVDTELVTKCTGCRLRVPIREAVEQRLIAYHVDRLDPLAFITTG